MFDEPNRLLLRQRRDGTILLVDKHEWTKFEVLADLEEAQLSVLEYIEMFYNTSRIHQTLNFKTPDELEDLHESSLASKKRNPRCSPVVG